MNQSNNIFIVVEGLDGSGKTEVSFQLTETLRRVTNGKVKLTYEPHDLSCAGLYIRQVLSKRITKFSNYSLALAFAVNRTDHCIRIIQPFLDNSDFRIIICDRYYLSSLVYQSTDKNDFPLIMKLNKEAIKPDITFFLNASNSTCFQRMNKRNSKRELFEKNLNDLRLKYFDAIDYLSSSGEKFKIIDANYSIDEVLQSIFTHLTTHFPQLANCQIPLIYGINKKGGTMDSYGANNVDKLLNEYILQNKIFEQIRLAEDFEETILKIKNNLSTWAEDLSDSRYREIFINYLIEKGYIISGELERSDIDALKLQYKLPLGLVQRGLGFIIDNNTRHDVLYKRIINLSHEYDFFLQLDLNSHSIPLQITGRELIATNRSTNNISPSVKTISKQNLCNYLIIKILVVIKEEFYNSINLDPNIKVFLEQLVDTLPIW